MSWQVGRKAFQLDDDLTQIQGMSSREGEAVHFSELISLKDFPKINDWLVRIESMIASVFGEFANGCCCRSASILRPGSRSSP